MSDQRLTIRPATAADTRAVRRLAELDTQPYLRGPALLAIEGADLVAAVALAGGEVIADPFRSTAEQVEMLQIRRERLIARLRAAASSSPSVEPAHRRKGLLRSLLGHPVANAR